MCRGLGTVAAVPTTASEMAAALAAVPDIPRKVLTEADFRRIDEIE